MKAKVAFGDDIRRWHYPTENRYTHLTSFVEKVFDLGKSSKGYFIQFEDAEMDKVTVCNEQDLMDAFECAEQEKRQSVKLFVTAGSVADTHESPTQDKTSSSNETKTEEPAEQKNCDWPQVVMDLLLDEKVRLSLPELVRRVISILRERKKNGGEVSLAEVVPLVLTEKNFESIVEHKLYKNYAAHMLPMLLSQASCFNHLLLSLNEEEVGKWVSDMLELVVLSFDEGKDNGLWKKHIDMWREEERNGGQSLHLNVQCDLCGMNPIRGIRYKCAVCEDYDLCEGCEASGQHSSRHPLVKMVRPMCQRMMGRCQLSGLHELVGRKHWDMHRSVPCWVQFACKNMSPCEKKKKLRKCRKNERKEKRMTKRQQKLLGQLEKINAELTKDNKMEAEQTINIACICGTTLTKTTGLRAYGHQHVACDRCGKDCSQDAFIYHCFNASPSHQRGFDICLDCATVCSQPEKEKKEAVKEKEEKVVTDVVDNTEKVEKEQPPKDPFEAFPHANEARALVEMGFADVERIKFLLINKKGDLGQAISELLP